MNNHEWMAFKGQLEASKAELEQLCREDERLQRLAKSARDLASSIGDELGRLSREFYDAESLWLRLTHNHTMLIGRISALRESCEKVETMFEEK